ncbi:MAG TPA: DoxX family membrane protein [Nitriliruptoraceae bacterium]|nr:DoxX family membrane protein [Nitriliruptoraceae bacterium]
MSAIARALVAAPFIVLGVQAAQEPGKRVDLARELGVPEPELAVRANGAGMVLGGVAVAAGVATRPAAMAVAALMVPTTLAAHAFWQDDDPAMRNANRIQFLKNVGLVGGLLAVAAAHGDDE